MYSESGLCSCPHLGLRHSSRQHYAIPDAEHCCYCRGKPRQIELRHQAQFCLHPGYYRCSALVASRPRRRLGVTWAGARLARVALGGIAALLVVSVVAASQGGRVDWSGLPAMLSDLITAPQRMVVGPAEGEQGKPFALDLATPIVVGQPWFAPVELTPDRFPRLIATPTRTAVPTARTTGLPSGSRSEPSARLLSLPNKGELAASPVPAPNRADRPVVPEAPVTKTPTPAWPTTPTPTVTPAVVKTPLGRVVSDITRHQGPELSEVARASGMGDAPKLCPGQNLTERNQADGKVK